MSELTIPVVLLIGMIFLAAFQQTISGFGFSLVVMPIATLLLGLKIAVPLIALAALTLCSINVILIQPSLVFYRSAGCTSPGL